MNYNKTYVGTELKMLLGFNYPADSKTVTLDNIDFDVEFYCKEGKSQKFVKRGVRQGGEFSNGIGGLQRDRDNWYAYVDTNITGPGMLKMKLTAYIPVYGQTVGNDMTRTEVAVCDTNVRIQK